MDEVQRGEYTQEQHGGLSELTSSYVCRNRWHFVKLSAGLCVREKRSLLLFADDSATASVSDVSLESSDWSRAQSNSRSTAG